MTDEEQGGGSFRFERSHVDAIGARERRLIRQTLRRLDSLPRDRAAEALQRAVSALTARIGYSEVPPAEQRAFLRDLLRASKR